MNTGDVYKRQVPGDDITTAVKRYWRHGLFSDCLLYTSLADNDLYCSSDGKSWSKMGTNTKFEKLIAGVHSEHNCKLYAIDTLSLIHI